MLVNRLKSALIATAGAGALFLGLASPALAGPVLLNPAAGNGGGACGGHAVCTIDSSAAAALAGAFPSSAASFFFSSDLQVNSLINQGPGLFGASETFNLYIFGFDGGVANHGVLTRYDLYITGVITGAGTWNSGVFTLNSPGSAVIDMYASPGNAGGIFTPPTFGDASQPTGAGNCGTSVCPVGAPGGVVLNGPAGVTAGLDDFLLAQLGITGAIVVGANPSANFNTAALGEQIGVTLGMFPTPGTTGTLGAPALPLQGFWQNVLPSGLNIQVSSTDSASTTQLTRTQNALNSNFYCTNATGCEDLKVAYGSGAVGSLAWQVQTVPEPGTLSLFGMGLLGLGFMFRRRNGVVSKA